MLSIALNANAETETQVTCPVGLSQPMEPGESGSRVHAFHPHITCSGRTEAADLRVCSGVSLETPEYPFTPFLSWALGSQEKRSEPKQGLADLISSPATSF